MSVLLFHLICCSELTFRRLNITLIYVCVCACICTVCLPLNNVLMTKWMYFRTYATCHEFTVSFSVKPHSLVKTHKSSGGNCCLTFCSVNGNSRVFQDMCTHIPIYLELHPKSLLSRLSLPSESFILF